MAEETTQVLGGTGTQPVQTQTPAPASVQTQTPAPASVQTQAPVEEMVPKSHVERAVSARVNELNQKYANYDKYQKSLKKLAAMAGLDSEEALLAQIELADSRGTSSTTPAGTTTSSRQVMDPELKRELEAARTETRETRFDIEEQKLVADPVYADLSQAEIKKATREYATKNSTDLRTAFWALYGPTAAKKQADAVEQRVRASLQEQLARSGVITEMTPEIKSLGLSQEELVAAHRSGFTPEQFAALKSHETDTLDGYRAMKARLQKK